MNEDNIKPAHKIDDPIELSEHALYFYSRHQWKQAVPYYERLFQDFSGKKLKEHFFSEIALCFLNLDDYDSAIEYLKEGMKRYQNIKKHKVLYAEALRLKGFHYQAKTLYEKLIGLYPDDIGVLQNHYMASANYYIRKDDIDKAIDCFKNCKALIPLGRSRHILDIEIEGWKLVRDIRAAIKKSWNFKILEDKLTPLLKTASDLDEKNLEIAGLLPMYEKIIESILESMRGQPIDHGFCKNLVKLNEKAGFFDNAKFIDVIIRFNDYVRDLKDKFGDKIPAKHQKNGLLILKTRSKLHLFESLNLFKLSGDTVSPKHTKIFDKSCQYVLKSLYSTDVIDEKDLSQYKEERLFIDTDNDLVFWMGGPLAELPRQEKPYRLLVYLLKHGCSGNVSSAIRLFYDEEKSRRDAKNRQKKNLSRIKSRLNSILSEYHIARVNWYGEKLSINDFEDEESVFEKYILVHKKTD